MTADTDQPRRRTYRLTDDEDPAAPELRRRLRDHDVREVHRGRATFGIVTDGTSRRQRTALRAACADLLTTAEALALFEPLGAHEYY